MNESTPVIDDGQFHYIVQSGDEQHECAVDLWAAKLLCERLETQHALEIDGDGHYRPTAEFLCDLRTGFQSLGAEHVTPSVALNLWVQVSAKFNELQKKTSATPN